MLLDGHNNVGFSGGPVVFVENDLRPGEEHPFIVAGVVSSYPAPHKPFSAAMEEIPDYTSKTIQAL